jgi:hypothetical protein
LSGELVVLFIESATGNKNADGHLEKFIVKVGQAAERSFSNFVKQKRPFRRNGLTSNDCLPYENLAPERKR